ncbi:MAG: beta-N-acetylhexosaminidase, partial [Armatimonadetes bacterium]|nr:beta-N-acetylhexosaminidase [Armatimonadota bacterium]
GLWLAVPQAGWAGRWASASVGDITIGYGPDRGLSILYKGEVVVEGATLNFHDGQWKTVYYSLPYYVRDVEVVDMPEGKALRILGGPEDGSFSFDYQAIARPDNTVRILLSYTLHRDMPFGVEYCTVQLADTPVVGCSFVATGGPGAREGRVQLEAMSDGINDQTWVAHDVSEIKIQSRVGTMSLATDGEPWFCLFDARLRFCGNKTFGWFWGGKLGDSPPVGQTRRLDFTVRFEGGPSQPGPVLNVSRDSRPPTDVPSVAAISPQAEAPVLIPAPKRVVWGRGVFAIASRTPIVIRDNPAPENLRPALKLREEIEKRFGLRLRVRRVSEARRMEAAILLGEPDACPAVAKATPRRIDRPEGYCLSVSPGRLVVAGADPAGTWWGVQTLLQMLRLGANGPELPVTTITDWPDFPLRGAHLCVGEHDLNFVTRVVTEVLPRFKFNAVVLEIESIRWDSHPELAPKGPTPAEVGRLCDLARQHFVEPIPQIQSGGHCDYFLFRDGQYRDLAENPEAPYNYCPSNPDTYKLFFDLYAEVEKYMRPRYFHIGHDELNDDYAICPRCRGRRPAELFAEDVRRLRDWWAERGVPIMMWGDMLLAPVDAHGGRDAFNGGGKLNLSEAVPLLPKDVIIADWHYGVGYEEFPSFDFWQQRGFRIIAAPWFWLDNIWNITRDAKRHVVVGVLGTTWCSLASEEEALTRNLQYLGSLVYVADCSWSVGVRPPTGLPYVPAELFAAALQLPLASRGGPGFLVDLSAAGTRTLADADGTGWLGYGAGRNLSSLPVGQVGLAGMLFAIGPKAVVLYGPLAPPGLPSEVRGIRIGRRAAGLVFLHTCGWPAQPGQTIGAYRIHYADGSTEEVPLVYGRNIGAFVAPGFAAAAALGWRGTTPGGTPLWVYAWPWENPHPDREIASLDFVSAGTRAAPALLAVTGIARR